MEHLFSKLLEDFEQGRMNRRQLIQSLAVAATAAGAAAPARAGEGSGGFKTVTVNHISYVSSDYKRTRDFYADLMGMKVSHDDGRQCYLSFGDSFLIARNAREGSSVKPPLVNHIAYTIDNWDKNAVEAELKKRGLSPRPDTDDSFHVKDPDGYDLQIAGKGMKS